jgi:hypothetical protein
MLCSDGKATTQVLGTQIENILRKIVLLLVYSAESPGFFHLLTEFYNWMFFKFKICAVLGWKLHYGCIHHRPENTRLANLL